MAEYGNRQSGLNTLTQAEHDGDTTPTKKVSAYGYDIDNTTKKRLTGTTRGTHFALDTNAGGLEVPPHDYIAITYVPSGDGVGEIQTVVFKDGGSGGTTVATLTLTYNTDDKLATVTKT